MMRTLTVASADPGITLLRKPAFNDDRRDRVAHDRVQQRILADLAVGARNRRAGRCRQQIVEIAATAAECSCSPSIVKNCRVLGVSCTGVS